MFTEGGFEFHNSLENSLWKVIAHPVCVCVCMVSMLSSWWYRACVFLSSCQPEVNMKDSGLNGTSPGLWNLLSGLYGNTASTHIHKLSLTLRHIERTSTKGPCGETHSHTYTHTHSWSENSHLHLAGVWSSIKLHLSLRLFSLQGVELCLLNQSTSPSNSQISPCHFISVCAMFSYC